jgi:hypothetical protein
VKKVIVATFRYTVDITPGTEEYHDCPTLEACLELEKDSVLSDPEAFIGLAIDEGDPEVTFEDPKETK